MRRGVRRRFFVSYLLLPSLELSDTKVYEPQTRALLGTASHFCEVAVLKLRTSGGARGGDDALLLSSLALSDTKVYEPSIRALLGTVRRRAWR